MPDPDVTPGPRRVMSQAEYARHRGISKQGVNAHIKSGRLLPALTNDGQIDVEAADGLLSAPAPSRPGSLLQTSKAEKARIDAEVAALDLARKKGEMVPRAAVQAAAQQLGATLRQALTDRRPQLITAIQTSEVPANAVRELDDILCTRLADAVEQALAA